MSVTNRRLFALAASLSMVVALAAPPAHAQDSSEGVGEATEPLRAPQRARRGWLPALRLRWIAPVSDAALEASEGEREEARATRERVEPRPPWRERSVAPSVVPCASEPGGGADCAGAVTVVLTSF